ncbi:sulfatase-like hydrolase/transferase [Acidobacteria bacterium AH-259-A15]|nr:sulfatase-like hydrolase/transferase [Acidobacteria bacterium AH-259-A15]
MKRHLSAGLGALCVLAVLVALSPLDGAEGSAGPPNVVFIFVDDMGYGDLSSTGNKDVQTKNIDRLAAEGIRFTQFYVNSPICSPSRVAITTGQYPARHLIHSFLAGRKRNRERGMRDYLDPSAPSVARAFQQAGYVTAHFGKWHMGGGRDVNDAPLPQAYGFDESLVSFEGLGDRVLPPGRLAQMSEKLGGGKISHAPKHKLTEIYVDRSIDFIRRNKDRSFYLHLWLNDVHDRHLPRQDLLPKYERFKANPYVQRFYAVMGEMDRQLGRLIEAIDGLGLGEKTLIVLTSDNGPTAWPRYYEEGFDPPGSTAGFRGRKWSLYEGGIRMPLMARWKGKIPAGVVDEQTVMAAIDLFPTFCKLAGVEPPEIEFDGLDMSPALLGTPQERTQPIFWEYGRDETYLRPGLPHHQSPNLAIREGRWKLLINDDGSRLELYDFDTGANERGNLADRHPEVAKRLSEKLLAWRSSLPKLQDVESGLPSGPKPNIVIIMVDDMGYSDPGCYGGEIDTPNLDSLASNGLRFSQFYNTSRCCPTRAALMTGLYPHQAGVGRMTFDSDRPGYRGFLQANTVTIAEVLGNAGYGTAMVGKWHLSLTGTVEDQLGWLNHQADYGAFSDLDTYPVARGFEEHYGTIWGVVNYFDPFSLVHNTRPVTSIPKDYYYTVALSDYAVKFIEKYSRDGDPFFLYVAYTAPHWPLHALPEDIEKYEDTYKVGWDAIREARYVRMVNMGLIQPDRAILSTRHRQEIRWEDNPTKDWDARAMAVHAAMVDRVDRGIGRIIDKLKQLKLLDSTLILFFSDNGASPEEPRRPGFDRPSETRDGRKMVYGKSDRGLPGIEQTFSGIGPMWANASNTPFRYWKKEQYEGGVCTPLIVHWPDGITARPGSITHQPGHVIDILATCLEVAGAQYPTKYKGHQITPLEGKSLLPIFHAQQRAAHAAIFFEHFGARAVRKGDWKLVKLRDQPWDLYNLARDRTEMNNLAAKYPDKVKALEKLWEKWAERCQVVPTPGS